MMKGTVAAVNPVAGAVCAPFRYFQSSIDPPEEKRPTQSLAAPGPLAIVAVTVPPGVIVVGLAVKLTVPPPPVVTVTVALVASSADDAEKKRRL